MHRTSQWFRQRRVFQRNMVRNMQRVLGHNPRRYADEFRISSIVEEQVVTKILLAAFAEKTMSAGSGIQRHHPVAGAKSVTPSPACTTVPASS